VPSPSSLPLPFAPSPETLLPGNSLLIHPSLSGIAALAARSQLLLAKRRVEYREIESRSILNRCSAPRMPFQWTINPYRGCEFACRYCYARYAHEFMELAPEEFDDLIYAKKFDAGWLRQELRQVRPGQRLALGTATDPYQPAERRFGRTRAILEAFARERGYRLSITTKSDLILRDLELLQEVGRRHTLHVHITITTIDPELARLLEARAPHPAKRMDAVRQLAAAGLSVGVFASPVLPYMNDSEASLDAVASAAAEAGGRHFGANVLFLRPCARAVFMPFLEQNFPALLQQYEMLFARSDYLKGTYPERVREIVNRIRERRGLAASPVDYRPEWWPQEQALLFPLQEESGRDP
jgi:DNA repair photolyase